MRTKITVFPQENLFFPKKGKKNIFFPNYIYYTKIKKKGYKKKGPTVKVEP
jgi:hypothetical protein